MINSIIQKPVSGTTMVTNIKCSESNKDLFLSKDISLCLNNYFTTIVSKVANSFPINKFSKTIKYCFYLLFIIYQISN